MASKHIAFERSLYIGNCFASILYGLQIWMYFQSVYWLLTSGKYSDNKMRWFYVVYGGVMLILLAFGMLGNNLIGQEAWIEHREQIDPAIYLSEDSFLGWYVTVGDATAAIVNIMDNGLLLYRYHIIWGSRRWVTAFPFLVFIASAAMAVTTSVEGSLALSRSSAGKYSVCLIAWSSLTVGLHIIVTTLICVRLLLMRHMIRSVLPPEVGAKYTSIVSIFVESALPFSLLGIGVVITVAMDSPVKVAFGCIWAMLLGIAPQLIILRVAMGSGWTKETVAQVTNPTSADLPGMLVFAPPTDDDTQAEANTSTLYSWARNSKAGRSQPSNIELQEV